MGEEVQGAEEKDVAQVLHQSTMEVEELDSEDERAVAQILDQASATYDAMLLRTAIQLNLFDIIDRGGGITLPQLAAALSPQYPINHNHLSRVLRYLVHMRLLSVQDDRYALTRVSERFLLSSSTTTTSLRSTVLMYTDEVFLSKWYTLPDALLTGSNMFGMKHGADVFDELARRPEIGVLFNESMAADTRLLMPAVVRVLKGILGGARSLVDVGGGTGTAACMVARAFPDVRCSVLDLPHVVRGADPTFVRSVELVEGNMFDCVPCADIVMIKRVLHDWDNEKCVEILRRSKDAIPSEGGKVIIIEALMDEEDNMFNTYNLREDLGMMFVLRGKERTRDEWNSLLHDAGLYLHEIVPLMLGKSIIHARPR